jgi:hypothetical protein
MYLFHIFHSFLPLRNPIGFGISDFIVLTIGVLLVSFLALRPLLEPYLRGSAKHTFRCMAMLFALPILLRIGLLVHSPVPIPAGADDFSYILLGDTLGHLRMANPPHPLYKFFESTFVLQEPTYASIYPLGQGLVLAFGRLVFQSFWAGVLISSGAFCALCYWMLKAWVTPMWALAGGLLAVIEFGSLNPWVNSYWGGLVSACAGCLVFGSLPRLRNSPRIRYGVLLGLGFGLQVLTRPFEAVFMAVVIAIYWAFAFRNKLMLTMRPAMAAIIVGAAALGLMLLQDKAVTHSWTTLPYMQSRYEYGVPTTLTFQKTPVPHRQLTSQQELDYRAQAAIHGSGTDNLGAFWSRLSYRFRYLRFWLLAPLYLVTLLSVPALRQRLYLWAAGTILLFGVGTNFYPYFFPQYMAAVTCLFVLFSLLGLQRLGSTSRLYVLLMCGASFVFWYGIYASGSPDLLPINDYQSWNYINIGDTQGRLSVQEQLTHSPGDQLVFVRYAPAHKFEEWVHNAANIDAAQTVWANDLGTDENEQLLRYYPNRKAWLLEPDAHPVSLTPYSRDSDLFQTVH